MKNEPVARANPRRALSASFVGLLRIGCCAPLLLSACQDVGFDASVPARMAPGVPIAIEAIEGPPETVRTAFSAAFTQAAASHEITVVDESQGPRYRLKGYLTAGSSPDGKAVLSYVWDVFDAANRRAQRVAGDEPTAGDPADPWSRVDDVTLRRVAAKSMDGIADFLANAGGAPAVAALTPRQVTAGASLGAVAGASGHPLGYAETQ